MKNAILKYGWDNVGHYILEKNISNEQASELEVKLIKSHRSNEIEFGYNMTKGGDSGCFGYKHSKEDIERFSKSLIGRKSWNKGMKGYREKSLEEIEKRKHTIKERYPDNHRKMPIHYVLQMDLDNNIIEVFNNVNDAIIKLGIKGIRKCCDMKGRVAEGFKFRYAEDFDKQYNMNWRKKYEN